MSKNGKAKAKPAKSNSPVKNAGKGKGKPAGKQPAQKGADIKKKQEQCKKLEEYVNDTGLGLAFQIIYSELIDKNIPQKEFYSYTAMRLKEIGKEVEGLKPNDIMYIPKPKPPEPEEQEEEEEDKKEDEEGVFMTEQDNKKKKNSKS